MTIVLFVVLFFVAMVTIESGKDALMRDRTDFLDDILEYAQAAFVGSIGVMILFPII